MRRVLSIVCLATVAAGCTSKSSESAKVSLSDAAFAQTAGAASATGDALAGTVVEHLSAAPYIYLRIKTTNGERWAAVPEAKIENGAQVTVYNALLMTKFGSKTLKRTFDEVYFGTLTAAAVGAGAPAAATAGSPMGTPPVVTANVGKVAKAGGADAHTIAELWAQKATLVGKTVTIRGVVVKYNEAVMAKNWLHLQDGSGDAKAGTNDITVTSLDTAAPGQTVTITGTVRTNKDFGAGYSYAMIIEDAKVVKK